MNESSQLRWHMEYGGFLPLELNDGKEYFDQYENLVTKFNSVKAAVVFLLNQLSVKQIYLPYYYCPSTIEAIRKTGIKIVFYHINQYLEPDEQLPDQEKSAVLFVNYFGVKTNQIKELSRKFNQSEVIFDNAHAFFAKPEKRRRIHNLYSAKKFFGVPDGAYLVSMDIIGGEKEYSYSYDYSKYLLTAYEKGTNAAYRAKKEADLIIAQQYTTMSRLANGLLKNVNYSIVKLKRETNYSILFQQLQKKNKLHLPKKIAAYVYPYLPQQDGEIIKKRLVEQRIYVPTLWNGEDLKHNGNSNELEMMNCCIFLPVDQRYNQEDINHIISVMHKIISVSER